MSDIELNLDYKTSKNPKNTKLLAAKDSVITTNEIWNIAPIMSTVFSCCENKDLINFNTVCKKWNLLTAPIIHRSIKILRNQGVKKRNWGKSLNEEKIKIEVEECITNNSKYSHYVKELRFCENIKPKMAIKFLETFKYLAKLHISDVYISQDQFLCMVKPLDKLEELAFTNVHINEHSENRAYKGSIQLPKTLTKLSLIEMKLNGNTRLFNNSINSHSNLKQFILEYSNESNLITPFYKNYPSLRVFNYSDPQSRNHQSLIRIIESNPQITSLKLNSNSLKLLMVPISKHLINLQDFELYCNYGSDLDFEFRFTQPIKIKRLKVNSRLCNSISWNSLLRNCPELEEFNYSPSSSHTDRVLTLTIDKPTKIRKLEIDCQYLSKSTFESILLNCPYLKDLDIIFPKEWNVYFDIVLQRCTSLEHLTLYSRYSLYNKEEYISLKFLSTASFKNTLTTLTLNDLNFCCSANSLHLQDYSNLKFVKFQILDKGNGNRNSSLPSSADLWLGYLKSYFLNGNYIGYKLTKIN